MATATKKLSRRTPPMPGRVAKILKPAKSLKPTPTAKVVKPATVTAPTRKATKKGTAKAIVVPPAKPQPVPALKVKSARAKKVTVPVVVPAKAIKTVASPQAARTKIKEVAKPAKSASTKPTTAKAKAVAPAPAKTPSLKSSATVQGTLALEMAPKGVRKRAPKDLATQYGEKVKPQRGGKDAPHAKATRAARKSAAERERLRQVIDPSDEVMHRLARIGAIGSTSEALEDEGKARRKSSTTRRSRNWELSCGKCGVKTKFSASAGVCPRCGTIVMRD